ncbi:MAG: 50S ribosomal protein L34e [Fervidicoccaceae archaeon]
MVRPSLRSTTHKRVKVRTPGGRLVLHVSSRKKDLPICSLCGKPLRGTAFGEIVKMRKHSLSSKRPNRYYGGVICHRCLAVLIKAEVRKLSFPHSYNITL